MRKHKNVKSARGDGRIMTDVMVLFKRIRTARRELSDIRGTMEELWFMLLPAGIRYDNDRVQVSPEDRLHELADELIDLEKVERQQIGSLTADILTAERVIADMKNPTYRELLRLRYLSGGIRPLTWEQVADRLGYDADHVRGRLHGNAIKEAQQIFTTKYHNDL